MKNKTRVYDVSFNIISGVFGGTCEKYWPLQPINGLKIMITLENVWEAFNYKFIPCNSLKGSLLNGSYPLITPNNNVAPATDVLHRNANNYESNPGLMTASNAELLAENQRIWKFGAPGARLTVNELLTQVRSRGA